MFDSIALPILQDKLNKRIAEDQAKSKIYLDNIESQGRLLNDFILPLGNGVKVNFESADVTDTIAKVQMILQKRNETEPRLYDLHPHAVMQAAEKLDINQSYVKSLVTGGIPWQTRLSAHILNEHAQHTKRQRILVREVGGQVRGILSDHYRRMNSSEIYASFIKNSIAVQGTILSAYADDTKCWITTILPQAMEIPTAKNGTIVLAYGIRLSTSDFGDGALEMRSFIMQLICMNGMVRESIVREIHLGRQIPDNIELSDQTYMYDTKTQASLVADTVKQLMSRDAILKQYSDVQKASEMDVDLDAEYKQLARVGMTKGEIDAAKQIITNNKTSDGVGGENTLWKLVQSVGAVANSETVTQRRSKELAEISGILMNRVNLK